MLKYNRVNFGRMITAVILVLSGSTLPAHGQSPEVLERVRVAEADHALVFELAERYDATYAPNVNLSDEVLQRIVVPIEPERVEGGVRFRFTPELCRIRNFFGSIWVQGTGLGDVKSVQTKHPGGGSAANWNRYGEGLLLRPYLMDVGDGQDVLLFIEGSDEVKITSLRLETRSGLSSTFDPSPFLGAAEDRPARNAKLNVSLRHWRSIGGISDFDRSKYFTIYSQPGNERYPHHLSELAEYGFQQGRQQFKFGPSLERADGVPNVPTLAEDPSRPGYHDASFFEQYENTRYAEVDPDLRFAMCFDNWPSFMEAEIPNHVNKRGTPEDFDAAAELVVDYLNDQIADSGRTATWWEVKNETDIQYEWSYHADPDADSWGLLIDFHNTIAEAVHTRVDPSIQIGGPSAAWPAFESREFGRWRDYQRFHDGTADYLDFFSYHFYYPAVFGPVDPHGYLDARLDMIQSHMHTTGQVRPVLITEFGVIGEPVHASADGRAWSKLKGFSAQWMRYFDRPDEFDLTVPFMLGYVHWNPRSDSGLWMRDEAGDFVKTHNYNVLRLWRDFDGKRIPSAADQPEILHQALFDGDTAYIAVYNNGTDRANVAVELDTATQPSSVLQRRLYFSRGELRFEELGDVDLDSVPVHVAETTLLVLRFDEAPEPEGVLAESSHYGAGTAVPLTDGTKTFRVEVDREHLAGLRGAELRLGLHRATGDAFGRWVEVDINGHVVRHDLASLGSEGVFGYVRVPLPPEAIQNGNDIGLRFERGGGTLASARLVTKRLVP